LNPADVEALLEGLAGSPELRSFRGLIEPLKLHDREHNSDLVRTLEVFFGANANASRAADLLFLHRNSLLYRLERVRELTGLDLKDHRNRFALQLGLLAVTEKHKDEHP
jgi:DNA-binding PucR family transcriptional regulator